MSLNPNERQLMELIERMSASNDDNGGKMTRIVFIGRSLTMLPTTIVALIHLTELHITANSLRTLPVEIGSLSSLLTLEVSCNQLTSLPREICQLRSLTKLDANANQLRSLPIEIYNLHKLEVLSVMDNRITLLPREIAQLKKLRGLFICGNRLRTLPMRSLDALANLQVSTFYSNPFEDMPSLRTFIFDDNVLQQYRTARVSLGAMLLTLLASPESLYRFTLPVCERVLRPLVELLVDDDDLLQCIYSVQVSCRRVFDARTQRTHKNT